MRSIHPIELQNFFSNFILQLYYSLKKRRYSCYLQINHGNLRLISLNRVTPKNNLPAKAGKRLLYGASLFYFALFKLFFEIFVYVFTVRIKFFEIGILADLP